MKKQKVYELTTNRVDGYIKYYVRGIKSDSEARMVARKVFGKKFYWASGISYYDDYPSKRRDWSKAPNKTKFIKEYKPMFDSRQ